MGKSDSPARGQSTDNTQELFLPTLFTPRGSSQGHCLPEAYCSIKTWGDQAAKITRGLASTSPFLLVKCVDFLSVLTGRQNILSSLPHAFVQEGGKKEVLHI